MESGIIPEVFKVAISPLSDKVKTELDNLVEHLFGNNGCSKCVNFPQLSFTSKGVHVTHTIEFVCTKVGQLFALPIILNTEAGKALLESQIYLQFDSIRISRGGQGLPTRGRGDGGLKSHLLYLQQQYLQQAAPHH
jgi:hypothetical protein